MTIAAPTVHLAQNDTVDRTVYNFTASSTPTGGDRIFAGVLAGRGGGLNPPTPTVTAFGITLTFLRVVNIGAETAIHLYEAASAGAAGTAVSVDFGVATIDHCSAIVVSHAGALPIVQHVAASSVGGTFVQGALGALTAGSGVAMFAYAFGAADYLPEAGYTEAADIAAAGGGARLAYEWRADIADATPRYSTAGSTQHIAIAFEIGSLSQATATMAGVATLSATGRTRTPVIEVIAGVEAELPAVDLLPAVVEIDLDAAPSVELLLDTLHAEVL